MLTDDRRSRDGSHGHTHTGAHTSPAASAAPSLSLPPLPPFSISLSLSLSFSLSRSLSLSLSISLTLSLSHTHATTSTRVLQTPEIRSQIKAMIRQGKTDDQIFKMNLPASADDLAKVHRSPDPTLPPTPKAYTLTP